MGNEHKPICFLSVLSKLYEKIIKEESGGVAGGHTDIFRPTVWIPEGSLDHTDCQMGTKQGRGDTKRLVCSHSIRYKERLQHSVMGNDT